MVNRLALIEHLSTLPVLNALYSPIHFFVNAFYLTFTHSLKSLERNIHAHSCYNGCNREQSGVSVLFEDIWHTDWE